MNKLAIFHEAKSSYCYVYKNKEVTIRIRTAKDDFNGIKLIYGDKYEWEKSSTRDMKCSFTDNLYDYYTVEVTAPSNRLTYYFELIYGDKVYYFTEWGLLDNIPIGYVHMVQFHYSYINNDDIHKTPEWVKDTVFYHIFPDRFANGDKKINPPNIVDWNSEPSFESFFGGDIKGIIGKLDYISDLGISGIYLTPIFQGTTNHRYDTVDYFQIDAYLGVKEDLKRLVGECHKRGIRVILDGVFNHCGYKFHRFQDLLEKKDNSKYKSWFLVKKIGDDLTCSEYEKFAFENKMPKLNTENEEVKKYLLDVCRYWIEEVDIDGWRLDASNEVNHEFWKEFRKVVKKSKEDAYIVGEQWHNSTPWLRGDQFDGVTNYPIMYCCIQYFAKGCISTNEFKRLVNNTLMRNTWQVNECMMNLLDSHDTARFIDVCDFNYKKMMLAFGFIFTFVGAISIYYGTEIGMTGAGDPECRKGMPWNNESWNKEVYNTFKVLIQIRNQYNSIRRGDFEWIVANDDILVYKRSLNDETIFFIANNSNKEKIVLLNEGKYLELISQEFLELNENLSSIQMNEYSMKILLKLRK